MAEVELLDTIANTAQRRALRNNEDSIRNTSLSRKLSGLSLRAATANPLFLGLNAPEFLWENSLAYYLPFHFPLPTPLNQGREGECIAYAIKTSIDIQMRQLTRLTPAGEENLHPVDAPEASLPYLLYVLRHLEDPTGGKMLDRLHDNGFIDSNTAVDEETGELEHGAQIYHLHWALEFYRDDFQDDFAEFDTNLKNSILNHGAVIVEFKVTKRYHRTQGPGVLTTTGGYLKETNRVNGVKIVRILGHAVVLVGWRDVRQHNRNTVEYRFLNSYGEGYGDRGYNWLRSALINVAFVPQVLEW